mgnify:CR=1 FL=1
MGYVIRICFSRNEHVRNTSYKTLDFFHDKPLYLRLVLVYRIGPNNNVSICLEFALSCFVCFPTHLLLNDNMHYDLEEEKRGTMYTIETVVTLHMLEHVAKQWRSTFDRNHRTRLR